MYLHNTGSVSDQDLGSVRGRLGHLKRAYFTLNFWGFWNFSKRHGSIKKSTQFDIPISASNITNHPLIGIMCLYTCCL